jgi:hypothetical protein
MATLKNLVEHMILIDIGKVPIEIASDLHACAITHADGIVHVDRDAMSAMWAADRAQYEADMAAYYAAQRKVA